MKMTKGDWAGRAFRTVQLAKECRAAGGHEPSGRIEAKTTGGIPGDFELCAHCGAWFAVDEAAEASRWAKEDPWG